MTENPLDKFDLEAFFDSVKTNGMANTLAQPRPELPEVTETETRFKTSLKQLQAKILMDYFSGRPYQNARDIALEFKENFEATKQQIHTYSTDEIERRVYNETTMKSLLAIAREKFGEATTKSGGSLPGSADEKRYRRDADSWNRIELIMEIAVTLGE